MVGGLLTLVGGLVAVIFGAVDLALGRAFGAAGALSEAVVLFVVGALVLLFAHLGAHGWKERPVASGVMLVILAVVGWAVMGTGANVLALIGGILALLAGVLYLIEPAQHVVARVASAT
ncbi:MAG TPA: hypothetical protein VMH49_05710 [Thermoplasmata archaeon]|nr:hypothetical protein [Thermoplasmata archaeon]